MQTTNNPYFGLLQWLLGGGFLASLLGFFLKKYFTHRPKISASLAWGGSTQSGDGNDRLTFQWHPKLTIRNDSIYKARRLTLIQSENISNWQFISPIPETIEADSKVEIVFNLTGSESISTIIQLLGEHSLREGSAAQAYLPKVIGRARLVFSYDNERDHTFYTVVTINHMQSTNTFHWVKPKPFAQ